MHDIVSVLGEFGIVYKGYITKSDSHSIEEYLAIKTLKGMLINDKYSLYLLPSSMYEYFDSH